jgi:DNA-directed RNA polymerase subunit L
MKLEIINKDKNFLEFRILGERHSLPNLLRARLSEKKEVEFVSYTLEHPMDNDSVFVLRTKGKEPSKVLLQVTGEIEKEIGEFETKLKKAVN